MGIEPTSSAWKAEVLPLNYTRQTDSATRNLQGAAPLKPGLEHLRMMVEGGGFEPPKAEPADLQSAPFGHSGTPPNAKRAIVFMAHWGVKTKFQCPINSEPVVVNRSE